MAVRLGFEAIKYIFTKALTKKGAQGIARIPGKAYDMRMKQLVDAMATKMRDLGYDVNKVTEKEVKGLLDSAEALEKQKLKQTDELIKKRTEDILDEAGITSKGVTDERGRIWDFGTKDLSKYTDKDLNALVVEDKKILAEANKLSEAGTNYGRVKEIEARRKEIREIIEAARKQVTDRPFPGANLKAVPKVTVDEHITFIKSKEPIESMKEANEIVGRKNPSYKGRYKNLTDDEAQKILKDTDDHIFQRDIQYDEFGDPIKPEPDYASGGRIGYAVGKIVKGGRWFIKNLKSLIEEAQNPGPWSRFSKMEAKDKSLAIVSAKERIRSIKAGGPIPDEALESILANPKFSQLKEGSHMRTDPHWREMEEVVLEYGKKRGMQSGGLAYMLGEPNTRIEALQHAGVVADPRGLYTDPSIYTKGEADIQNYYEGGGVGHGPWTRGQAPRPPEQAPRPGASMHPAQGQSNPMKLPQGLPSLAPRTMDPQYMQQQKMQQMMGQMGQQGQQGQQRGQPRMRAAQGRFIDSVGIGPLNVSPRFSVTESERDLGPDVESKVGGTDIGADIMLDIGKGVYGKGEYDKGRTSQDIYFEGEKVMENVPRDHDIWKYGIGYEAGDARAEVVYNPKNERYEFKLKIAFDKGGRVGLKKGSMRDRLQKDYKSYARFSDYLKAAPPKFWLSPEKYGVERDDIMTALKERFMYGDLDKKAEGGIMRIPFGLGSMSRRAFLKMMAAIAALPIVGKGVTKVAPKVIPKVTETVARGADGMPTYITDLIEVVKAKGTRDIIEGFKRSDYSTVHSYKGVDVIEDGAGNIKIKSDKSGVATDSYTGKIHEGIVQENHIQIDKGAWIEPELTKTGKVKKKSVKTKDEYTEGTVYPDRDGKMKDFEEGLDEAIHKDFKKIADELHEDDFYYPLDAGEKLKASGGLAQLLGE